MNWKDVSCKVWIAPRWWQWATEEPYFNSYNNCKIWHSYYYPCLTVKENKNHKFSCLSRQIQVMKEPELKAHALLCRMPVPHTWVLNSLQKEPWFPCYYNLSLGKLQVFKSEEVSGSICFCQRCLLLWVLFVALVATQSHQLSLQLLPNSAFHLI